MKYFNELIIKLGNWLIERNVYSLTDDEKYQLKLKAQNSYLQYKKKQREELINSQA